MGVVHLKTTRKIPNPITTAQKHYLLRRQAWGFLRLSCIALHFQPIKSCTNCVWVTWIQVRVRTNNLSPNNTLGLEMSWVLSIDHWFLHLLLWCAGAEWLIAKPRGSLALGRSAWGLATQPTQGRFERETLITGLAMQFVGVVRVMLMFLLVPIGAASFLPLREADTRLAKHNVYRIECVYIYNYIDIFKSPDCSQQTWYWLQSAADVYLNWQESI